MGFHLNIKPANGLSPKATKRNDQWLLDSSGLFFMDGMVQGIPSVDLAAFGISGQAFPFPQMFVFPMVTIYCTATSVYELNGAEIEHGIEVDEGSTWSGIAFEQFVYLTNLRTVVVRNAESRKYEERSDLPAGQCLCNFNGQVIVGAPDSVIYT